MNLLVKSFYVGEYKRLVDEKMRVALPAKWRPEEEVDTFLVLPNPIGCLTVYPPKMVARLEEKVSQVSFGDVQGQVALAKLFSKADTFSCDAKGRVKFEERLLSFAGIKSEVIFVGGGSVFNIWEPAKFEEYVSRESLEEVSSVLKGLGL